MKKMFINNFKDFTLKTSLYLPLFFSLLLNTLIWIYLVIKIKPTTFWIPLHYNVYFGIDWLGPWIQIFYYPTLGLLVILVNFLFSLKLQSIELTLSKLLIWTALIIQLIIISSIFSLIVSNF